MRQLKQMVLQPIKKQLRKQITYLQKRWDAYFDQTDVYIVSYPNSGRTWLRVLIGKALCEQFGLDETLLLDTRNISKAAGVATTEFTHDCSLVDKDSFYRTHELFFDKVRYRGKKILLIVRDPRDVMVSYYFQQIKRDGNYTGTISEFIRDDKFGIEKLLKFNQLWHENCHEFKEFKVLSYEEIKADTAGCLEQILKFMDVQVVSPEVLETSVQFSAFDNMKQLEQKNHWQNHARAQMVQARNTGDNDSYKARRGKIGGYTDYLTQEDIDYINQAISQGATPRYAEQIAQR